MLSISSRIFEKLVYRRLITFGNKHNILYSSPWRFRSRHSTQHATLEILNDILTNFDKGQFTFCLFIDFKKAFDKVNYDIVLSKLENYGFRGVVNDSFKSYLIGCRQYTTANMVICLMLIKPSVEYPKVPWWDPCFFSCIYIYIYIYIYIWSI